MKHPFIIFIIFSFIFNTLGPIPLVQAQELLLPTPGVMVHLSPEFNPPMLKGITIHPDDPFKFDFILDQGDNSLPLRGEGKGGGNQGELKQESAKLVKYFLAAMTTPENDLWVNLSPYERNHIIPSSFGQTDMGRDLLAEDYILKQVTASLIYPEDRIGKEFWKRIYEEAQKKFGTTNIPVNTFNKVWIVPDHAKVYEHANTAFVIKANLKVMLEEDYLSLAKHSVPLPSATRNDISSIGANIVRQIIIPELQKEVNQGKNFATLRQVYYSLILATWFKKRMKDSILGHKYMDQNKVDGIHYNPLQNLSPTRGHVSREAGYVSPSTLPSETALNAKAPQGNNLNDIELIYQRYLRAFKKGVFNYIKEEPLDAAISESTTIPRKYFSGGFGDVAAFTKNGIDYASTASYQETYVSSPLQASIELAITPPKTNEHEELLKLFLEQTASEFVIDIYRNFGDDVSKFLNNYAQLFEMSPQNLRALLDDYFFRNSNYDDFSDFLAKNRINDPGVQLNVEVPQLVKFEGKEFKLVLYDRKSGFILDSLRTDNNVRGKVCEIIKSEFAKNTFKSLRMNSIYYLKNKLFNKIIRIRASVDIFLKVNLEAHIIAIIAYAPDQKTHASKRTTGFDPRFEDYLINLNPIEYSPDAFVPVTLKVRNRSREGQSLLPAARQFERNKRPNATSDVVMEGISPPQYSTSFNVDEMMKSDSEVPRRAMDQEDMVEKINLLDQWLSSYKLKAINEFGGEEQLTINLRGVEHALQFGLNYQVNVQDSIRILRLSVPVSGTPLVNKEVFDHRISKAIEDELKDKVVDQIQFGQFITALKAKIAELDQSAFSNIKDEFLGSDAQIQGKLIEAARQADNHYHQGFIITQHKLGDLMAMPAIAKLIKALYDVYYWSIRFGDYALEETYPKADREAFWSELAREPSPGLFSQMSREKTYVTRSALRYAPQGRFPEPIMRGSLNVPITREIVEKLDRLLLEGIFEGQYKFYSPAVSEKYPRIDTISLYFYKKPSEELIKELKKIANENPRKGELINKFEDASGFTVSETENIQNIHAEDLYRHLLMIDHNLGKAFEGVILSGKFRGKDDFSEKRNRFGLSEGEFLVFQRIFGIFGIQVGYNFRQGFSLRNRDGIDLIQRVDQQPQHLESVYKFEGVQVLTQTEPVNISLGYGQYKGVSIDVDRSLFMPKFTLYKDPYGVIYFECKDLEGKISRVYVVDGFPEKFFFPKTMFSPAMQFEISANRDGISVSTVLPQSYKVISDEVVFKLNDGQSKNIALRTTTGEELPVKITKSGNELIVEDPINGERRLGEEEYELELTVGIYQAQIEFSEGGFNVTGLNPAELTVVDKDVAMKVDNSISLRSFSKGMAGFFALAVTAGFFQTDVIAETFTNMASSAPIIKHKLNALGHVHVDPTLYSDTYYFFDYINKSILNSGAMDERDVKKRATKLLKDENARFILPRYKSNAVELRKRLSDNHELRLGVEWTDKEIGELEAIARNRQDIEKFLRESGVSEQGIRDLFLILLGPALFLEYFDPVAGGLINDKTIIGLDSEEIKNRGVEIVNNFLSEVSILCGEPAGDPTLAKEFKKVSDRFRSNRNLTSGLIDEGWIKPLLRRQANPKKYFKQYDDNYRDIIDEALKQALGYAELFKQNIVERDDNFYKRAKEILKEHDLDVIFGRVHAEPLYKRFEKDPSVIAAFIDLSQMSKQEMKHDVTLTTPGGIDLTAKRMNLEIDKDRASVSESMDLKALENIEIKGLYIKDIELKPMNNLAQALGVSSH